MKPAKHLVEASPSWWPTALIFFRTIKAMLWLVLGFYMTVTGILILVLSGCQERPPFLGGAAKVHIVTTERWTGP